MKKLLLTFLASLMLTSVFADPITPERAMQIAQEYIIPGNVMKMTTRAKARRASTQNAPYYIISRGANLGFVIVAGDDCLPEVLGYTESGDFDSDNVPPALQDMLDAWQMGVENAQADGSNVTEAKARKARRRAASNRVNIAPFVTAHWHQSSPYNDICPTREDNGARAMTGCVATAASQILYYWRKDLPSTLQSTTPTYSYGGAHPKVSIPKGHPMKWDLMLDQYNNEPKEYKQAVAEFVYSVGTATWLTYAEGSGTATAGNIEKIPYTFSAYFGMNGGEVKYRDSYSQESWTQLIYNELKQGRPVMYTGVHPDNGGHAVFIHGYQASTDKMYFNFGWGAGNGYDGYYTTDQTTGMNGFCGYQSCLVGAYPKKWNIEAKITPSLHTYSKVDNTYTVAITNNSTLDLQDVYIFTSTSSAKPTDLKKASSSDSETLFKRGETTTTLLTVKPSNTGKTYVTLTDSKLSIIAQMTVEAEAADANLAFESIDVDSSSDVTEHAGQTYTTIYNDSKAVVNVLMRNTGNSAWSGSGRAELYCLDESTNEWEHVKSLSNAKAEVAKSGVSRIEFSATSLEQGKYYYVTCAEEWGLVSPKTPVDMSKAKTPKVYFTLKGNDMEVVSFTDNVLKIKGHFDNTVFNNTSFAKKTAHKTATAYDLTECVGVGVVTQDVNPNALYYVSDDSKAEGQNIVKAGKCKHLSLTMGYNFVPVADFVAEKAELCIGENVGKWQLVTTPFDAKLAEGQFAREDTLFRSNNIKTEDVTALEAGKTYLLMCASSRTNVLRGENVNVAAKPQTNADPSIVGTYTATKTPAGAMLVDDEEKQYFSPVDEGTAVVALGGYFVNSASTMRFRAYASLTLDPAYTTLAQNIEEATQLLNKYADLVTPKAYDAFLAKIQEAETEFALRTLTTSTAVKKLYEALIADGDEYLKHLLNAVDAEVDFTDNIVNASFEKKTATGWTVGKKEGISTTGSVVDGTQANNNRSVGLEGKYVFQSLIVAADSSSVGIEQFVKGLKPGYYRLTAMLGTDAHSTVTLFAGDSEVSVPGNAFGNLYLSKVEINDILVVEDDGDTTGSLLIGVKAGRWYKADDFRLTLVKPLYSEVEPDAIQAIAPSSMASGIYTLQGVKVKTANVPGMYIIDGKKTWVR